MMVVDMCPRCHLIVPSERMHTQPVVCNHCGWLLSGQERKAQMKLNASLRKAILFTSIGLLALLIHLVTWDHFFLEIIPLKGKQIMGLASTADLVRISSICRERKNQVCSEQALQSAVHKQPEQIELWAQLGHLQYQLRAYDRATYSLQTYFSRGGRDVKTAFEYAQSLGELGRTNEAAQYYEYVLEAKVDTLQISVTQKYVDLLTKNGQYTKAIEVIEAIRDKGSNASTFLDAELQDLKKKMKKEEGKGA